MFRKVIFNLVRLVQFIFLIFVVFYEVCWCIKKIFVNVICYRLVIETIFLGSGIIVVTNNYCIKYVIIVCVIFIIYKFFGLHVK